MADDQHPDHQLWINRWSAGVRVVGGELGTQIREIENRVDLAQQVIGRHYIVEIELIEQAALRARLLSHYRCLHRQ